MARLPREHACRENVQSGYVPSETTGIKVISTIGQHSGLRNKIVRPGCLHLVHASPLAFGLIPPSSAARAWVIAEPTRQNVLPQFRRHELVLRVWVPRGSSTVCQIGPYDNCTRAVRRWREAYVGDVNVLRSPIIESWLTSGTRV